MVEWKMEKHFATKYEEDDDFIGVYHSFRKEAPLHWRKARLKYLINRRKYKLIKNQNKLRYKILKFLKCIY